MDPAEEAGWEGDGTPDWEQDEGYFSDDDTGFFEGAEGGEAEEVLETVVFGTEEEAAAIGAALSSGELAELEAAVAVWGTSTVTAGSFLAWVWGALGEGKPLANAQQIPKEKIHTATKTKDNTKTKSKKPDTTATATTSEGPSCPTGKVVSLDNLSTTIYVMGAITNNGSRSLRVKRDVCQQVSNTSRPRPQAWSTGLAQRFVMPITYTYYKPIYGFADYRRLGRVQGLQM